MAKGFGLQKKQAVRLCSRATASALEHVRQNYQSMPWPGVIGVTNMLEQAQVWQRQQQAKQAIPKYAEVLA